MVVWWLGMEMMVVVRVGRMVRDGVMVRIEGMVGWW